MSTERVGTLAWIVSGTLAVYGIGSVIGRGLELHNLWDGVVASAVDPGFTVFHVLLLPLGVFVLVHHFPVALLNAAWKRRPVPFLLLVAAFFGSATYFTVDDAREAVCRRPSSPEIFGSPSLKACLLYLRKVQLGTASLTRPDTCPTTSQDSAATSPEARLSPIRTEYTNQLKQTQGPECIYGRSASGYALYGAMGSVAASWSVAFMVFLPFLPLLLGRQTVRDHFWDVYLTVFALLALWLVLVPLSQWYLNFGQWDYPPLQAVLVAALVAFCGWIFIFLRHRGMGQILRLIVIVIGGIVGFIAKFKAEWIEEVAVILYSQNTAFVIVMYVLLAALIILLSGYSFGAHDEHENRSA